MFNQKRQKYIVIAAIAAIILTILGLFGRAFLPRIRCSLGWQEEVCQPLASEVGIDYGRLQQLLQEQQWQQADQETYQLFLRATARKQPDWLTPDAMLTLPCTDLQTIDQLWLKASQGKFSLSVQQQIWAGILAQVDPSFDPLKQFSKQVEWSDVQGTRLKYDRFNFSLTAPQGHLPSLTLVKQVGSGATLTLGWTPIPLFHRVKTCKTPALETRLIPQTGSDLSSVRSVEVKAHYTKLQMWLENQEWVLADAETGLLLSLLGSPENSSSPVNMAQISCQDLKNINHLWHQNSRGRFSYEVQHPIWQKISPKGAPQSSDTKFDRQVGRTASATYLTLSQVPLGFYPSNSFNGITNEALFDRLTGCGM